jgi:hypothetical protein
MSAFAVSHSSLGGAAGWMVLLREWPRRRQQAHRCTELPKEPAAKLAAYGPRGRCCPATARCVEGCSWLACELCGWGWAGGDSSTGSAMCRLRWPAAGRRSRMCGRAGGHLPAEMPHQCVLLLRLARARRVRQCECGRGAPLPAAPQRVTCSGAAGGVVLVGSDATRARRRVPRA